MKSLPTVPELLPSLVAMKFPNEPIIAHSGEFEISSGTQSVKVTGDIAFRWFPEVRITFSGHCLADASGTFNHVDILLEQESALSLVVEGFLFGKCHVTRAETVETHAFIRGIALGTSHIKDITIPVEKVSFCIANLRDFNGSPTIDNTSEHKISYSNSRLTFSRDDYTITIDKIGNHKSAYDILSDEGGYNILYSGELTNAKRNIKYNEIQDLTHCFSIFLSFLNGRRCSMLFLKGMFDNEVIWEDFTSRFTDPYSSVFSWPSQNNISGLNNLWQSFSALWQSKDHREFIIASIHWYIEANSHSGFTEGSIIMTQTALELLYNWLVIEQKGLLAGKDAENISAANKIRLLLSILGVPNQVPAALSNLSKLVNENQEIADGPDAFVLIRNAIVHSQESKRKKLMKIPTLTKYEALKLGLWYLELALLYSFEFEGAYRNRCSASKWAGSDEETVPWAK